jgi:16S rRNA processing protein RimM
VSGRSSSKSPTDGLLLAGQIGKPHGIHGEVYVVPISDDPERFEPGSTLLDAGGRRVVVEAARVHRDRLLVKFAGIEDRNAAEARRGLALYVPREARRDLSEDEFWVEDLVGLEGRLPDGTPIGRVTAVHEGTAHDHLEVATEAGPRLVPVVKAIVTRVDLGAGVVTIDPPAGLLD